MQRIRKEMVRVECQNTLQDMICPSGAFLPVSLHFIGSGAPTGNDPGEGAQHILTQSLLFQCRNRARTARELAEEMNIPLRCVVEELEEQCRGVNGQYGLLRRIEQDKYITNILIVDREEYEAAGDIYRRYASTYCGLLAEGIAAGQEELCCFLRRYTQGNVSQGALLWSLLPDLLGNFIGQVGAELDLLFAEATPKERPFTTVAVAELPEPDSVYGCDSIVAHNICGYSNILVRSLYGRRLPARFHCGHDLAGDMALRQTIRCAGGMFPWMLSGEEREAVRQALELGYLRENCGSLEPAILILADDISAYMEFQSLLGTLEEDARALVRPLAEELAAFMREHIPEHLRGEYPYYNSCIAANGLFDEVAEEGIGRGILPVPEGPEGMLMVLCV